MLDDARCVPACCSQAMGFAVASGASATAGTVLDIDRPPLALWTKTNRRQVQLCFNSFGYYAAEALEHCHIMCTSLKIELLYVCNTTYAPPEPPPAPRPIGIMLPGPMPSTGGARACYGGPCEDGCFGASWGTVHMSSIQHASHSQHTVYKQHPACIVHMCSMQRTSPITVCRCIVLCHACAL